MVMVWITVTQDLQKDLIKELQQIIIEEDFKLFQVKEQDWDEDKTQ